MQITAKDAGALTAVAHLTKADLPEPRLRSAAERTYEASFLINMVGGPRLIALCYGVESTSTVATSACGVMIFSEWIENRFSDRVIRSVLS